MFQVKKIEYVNKTLRMPVELVSFLQNIAQAKEVSFNNLVIQCCEYAISHMDVTDNENNILRTFGFQING